MKTTLITNIQRYSIHDGEGIRTTVFFKGCPLNCRWCHNPETKSRENQLLFYEERCTGCGNCRDICPHDAIENQGKLPSVDKALCSVCGACVEECVNNARENAAQNITVKDMEKELLKDRVFYETSHGGVTLSGGEPLSGNLDYLEQLMERMSENGISVNIDTCGTVPYEAFERVLPYTDCFLYDVKMIDEKKHKYYTGMSNKLILENLKKLSLAGARIWLRMPIIGTVNDSVSDMEAFAGFVKDAKIRAEQIHLLPYHDTGSSKYKRLGEHYEGLEFYTPKAEEMEIFRKLVFQKTGIPVIIGG